jgi:hypothetical protein
MIPDDGEEPIRGVVFIKVLLDPVGVRLEEKLFESVDEWIRTYLEIEKFTVKLLDILAVRESEIEVRIIKVRLKRLLRTEERDLSTRGELVASLEERDDT